MRRASTPGEPASAQALVTREGAPCGLAPCNQVFAKCHVPWAHDRPRVLAVSVWPVRRPERAKTPPATSSSTIRASTARRAVRSPPGVFTRSLRLGQSVVGRQPTAATETLHARMAIISCPTSSIGSESKADVRGAVAALPARVEGEVFYCGHASESSHGAASYLVRREAGNASVSCTRRTSAPPRAMSSGASKVPTRSDWRRI